jgi:hypothetical protein
MPLSDHARTDEHLVVGGVGSSKVPLVLFRHDPRYREAIPPQDTASIQEAGRRRTQTRELMNEWLRQDERLPRRKGMRPTSTRWVSIVLCVSPSFSLPQFSWTPSLFCSPMERIFVCIAVSRRSLYQRLQSFRHVRPVRFRFVRDGFLFIVNRRLTWTCLDPFSGANSTTTTTTMTTTTTPAATKAVLVLFTGRPKNRTRSATKQVVRAGHS